MWRAFFHVKLSCFLSFSYFSIVNKHFAFVEQFTFMPVCTVIQVSFTCCSIYCDLRRSSFEVRSSFVSSGFRYFSLRMRHFIPLIYCYGKSFNLFHRGSLSSSGSKRSLGCSSSSFVNMSESNVPSSIPG